MTHSDDELVTKCLGGRKLSCNDLFKRHYEKILRHFMVKTRQNDLAYNLTQETFAKAFASLQTWNRESKFSTWLFTIAINVSRDFARQQYRHRENQHVSLNDEDCSWGNDASLTNTQNTPEHVFQEKELKNMLDDMISLLPEDEREVILLRFRGDEPIFKEISEITGHSVGNTHILFKRALTRIGKMLKKYHAKDKR